LECSVSNYTDSEIDNSNGMSKLGQTFKKVVRLSIFILNELSSEFDRTQSV